MTCPWCDGPLPNRPNRGHKRIYCSGMHRRQAGTAMRAWAQNKVRRGEVTLADIRRWFETASPAQVSA